MAAPNEEELARLQQKVIEEFRELGRVTPETAKALHDAQTEIQNFNFKVEAGTKFLSKLGDAVANTTKAMYRGEKGAAAFNQSVGDMADAAQIAAVGLSLLIPGGPVMKAVVAGLTYLGTSAIKAGSELVQTANKQSDSLYSAFQKMSKSGASASDGLTGVFGDIQKLGLGIQDLDGYINMINESSRDLALFRGNVADGRKAFADMNQQMKPFTEQLYNAGLSQEDITHGAMGYLKIQTMIGRSQTMTTEQLAQGAKKYLIEQDALTKLTGQSRQEAEAARAKAESEQRFRAVVESMRRSGDAQQIKAAQELVNANQVLSSVSEEAGAGFRDLTTGMITTDAGLKAYNSSNGEALRIATEMRAGNIDAIAGVQGMAEAFGTNADALNSMAQTGVYEDFGIKFADSVKLGNLAMNDLTEMFKKVVAEQEKQGVTGKKALDEVQQTQTEIRLAQKEAMLATQELVQLAVPSATKAMLKLAEAANAAAQALLTQANAKSGTAALKEQRTAAAYSNNEAVGAAGEVGQVAAEGEIAAGAKSQPQNIKSVKNMNWLDKLLVGSAEVKRREAAEAGGQTPAQAANVALPGAVNGPGGTQPNTQNQQGTTANVSSYSNKLVDYIKKVEGFTAKAFWDKKQYTNGYGTQAAGPNEVVSKQEAEKRLQDSLQKAVSGVLNYGKSHNYNWAQGQVDALTSFVYNAGLGQLDNLTAKGKRTNEQIAQSLLLYNKARDDKTQKVEEIPGLTKRRQEEMSMFQGAKNGGVFDGPLSGYPMTLHGQEAVIPLKNGSVPVTINPTGLMNLMPSLEIDNDTADQISESFKAGMNVDFSAMVDSLNELVNQQKNQNSTGLQERMIALLEDLRSSQSTTADNTSRMAAVASN